MDFRIPLACAALLLGACSSKSTNQAASAQAERIEAAAFDADSAFVLTARQVEMGPRVPGTPGHERCRAWIVESLKNYGADTVAVCPVSVKDRDGKPFTAYNIFARFGGTDAAAAPLLLLAHYDTRPWADAEKDTSRHSSPVPGANDGASGVAVLLETARQLGLERASVPVDLLFVDAEDGGISGGGEETTETWCLGTQGWTAQSMPYTDLWPRFGILLDMVGGRDARFHREYYSDEVAPGVLDRVWQVAAQIGEGERFVNRPGGAVVDDHIWLNASGIRTIDIIENMNPATGSFNPTWHTLADDLSGIDAATLGSVGRVVNTVIRSEK